MDSNVLTGMMLSQTCAPVDLERAFSSLVDQQRALRVVLTWYSGHRLAGRVEVLDPCPVAVAMMRGFERRFAAVLLVQGLHHCLETVVSH